MNANDHEMKFEKMKHLCKWMIALPVMAMVIAIIVFALEGFPYPGRSGFSHSFLSVQLARGLLLFDLVYLFVLILLVMTLIPLAILIWNRSLRKIHPAVRFPVLVRLVIYAWVAFLASRLMLSTYFGVLFMPEVLMRNFIFGGLLLAAYFYLRKRFTEKPETMFP